MFLGPRQQRPNFDGFIYIHNAAPPYSARVSAIYLRPFIWQSLVGLRLLTWQRSRTQNLQKVDKNSGPILSRLWTKVHEIFKLRQYRRSLVLFNILERLSMACFVQKIFAIKSRSCEKTEQM